MTYIFISFSEHYMQTFSISDTFALIDTSKANRWLVPDDCRSFLWIFGYSSERNMLTSKKNSKSTFIPGVSRSGACKFTCLRVFKPKISGSHPPSSGAIFSLLCPILCSQHSQKHNMFPRISAQNIPKAEHPQRNIDIKTLPLVLYSFVSSG